MKFLFSTATALALFVSPVFAQDPSQAPAAQTDAQSSGSASSADDRMARDSAMESAKGAGMSDVTVVERAFVLQGTNAAGNPVFMIVDPPGALLGIGAPIAVAATSPGSSDASRSADAETADGTAKTVEEMAGEPAQTGYMATQTDPASPQMWDPMMVEQQMRDLGLDKPAQ
ncbi:hypothetical protein U0C82_16845 [Fulvimarina sp. 2208YS6-2-32]|uniref:PRC-barrel domain-containing protein n=1 Tax=Fulvimarina uroteuthidis TaxID=3098149 RepID=A0ABU5I615_9HYPH|nr:hypothetical protein [Fulvimarina sp. 2208YS6-2-32]MDY8110810.1 hypothetical protein [Fulvimarina sp. 2208YS6-2-32]